MATIYIYCSGDRSLQGLAIRMVWRKADYPILFWQ
jgi:hypothetical protein